MSEEAVSLHLCMYRIFSECILGLEEKSLVFVLTFPNRYKLQSYKQFGEICNHFSGF